MQLEQVTHPQQVLLKEIQVELEFLIKEWVVEEVELPLADPLLQDQL
jgi:hypothetical protein